MFNLRRDYITVEVAPLSGHDVLIFPMKQLSHNRSSNDDNAINAPTAANGLNAKRYQSSRPEIYGTNRQRDFVSQTVL